MGYLANQEPSPQDTVRWDAQGGSLGQGNCAHLLCQTQHRREGLPS